MRAKNTDNELLLSQRKKISAILKQRRKDIGKSTREMAEEIGTSQSTIVKVENGQWNYGIETLSAFCEVLNLEIEVKPRKK